MCWNEMDDGKEKSEHTTKEMGKNTQKQRQQFSVVRTTLKDTTN